MARAVRSGACAFFSGCRLPVRRWIYSGAVRVFAPRLEGFEGVGEAVDLFHAVHFGGGKQQAV